MKPILKLYRGYANEQELIVIGRNEKTTTIGKFSEKNLKNATSVIKMFQIKTQAETVLHLMMSQ
jgi:hypothetical protein